MRSRYARAVTLVVLAAVALSPATAQHLPYVNWENHPVHALDLSPDGATLAVAHTADNRVQLFDVSEGRAVPIGHVAVGVDPVAVRFRDERELWVVNHISDSVSIVDVERQVVTATVATLDEPADVVFAGGRAFVSCSQANKVMVFDPAAPGSGAQIVAIAAEDPRALAVSADGSRVLAAIFESGNATTILGGGVLAPGVLSFPPNVTRQVNTPYGGQNPPPNDGPVFTPAVDPALPSAPAVGLIVRRSAGGRWLDDNGGDWTAFVSGNSAPQSGRPVGWDLPDRDIAIIDVASLEVTYATGLMNIGMAIAVNPGTAEITLIGTEATNEVRFEPNLNGRFVRVHLARVNGTDPAQAQVTDLNPHLDYRQPTRPQAERDRALGDPRAIVWHADGERGYVAGMGSNNVVVIDASGARVAGAAPIEVGAGPVALALDEAGGRLYVWNHFEASLSTITTGSLEEIDRLQVFNPLPAAIRDGRRFFYGTHETSGLGQLACASCHVDGRMDRLAWDLGDPSGAMKGFNQNCVTDFDGDLCPDFHPMKGPMMTQTFQDIVGHEPFHWRGDRDGLEEFNPAFKGLLGDDVDLTATEMQAFEDFVATITFPPNPFRNLDNSLPTALSLEGHFTTGRFSAAGQPLGVGNAVRGLELYTGGLLDDPFHCANCHTLPTGMAVNGALFAGDLPISTGGEPMPAGSLGENHLGIVSIDGSTNGAIKVPQIRNAYEKTGFDLTQPESTAGFGFLHDGSVDSLARFVGLDAFSLDSDQDVADLVALMLAFSGSDFPLPNPMLGAAAPLSRDTHAAVGAQRTLTSATAKGADELLVLARTGAIDLIARSANGAWAYDAGSERLVPADAGTPVTPAQLLATAAPANPLTLTAVPAGLGPRLGIDRDGDGIGDSAELEQGSNPADAASATLSPTQGLWFNPARSGHGFDLQRLGEFLFITWYTYNDDGSPTWYQAAAEFTAPDFSADLNRFRWNPDTGFVDVETVGTASLSFSDATHVEFAWQIGERPGNEPFELLLAAPGRTLRDYTGTWYDPSEPGWGLTLYTKGDTRVAVVYFYDADNEPRWALGQSDNAPAGVVEMLSFEGFCPDCARVDPTILDGGSIELEFESLRAARFSSAVDYPGLAGSGWPRADVAIVPLSDPAVDFSVF